MKLRFIPTGSNSSFYEVLGTPHEVFIDSFTNWAKVIIDEPYNKGGRRFWRTLHKTGWFRELNDALIFVKMVDNMDESPYAMGWSL